MSGTCNLELDPTSVLRQKFQQKQHHLAVESESMRKLKLSDFDDSGCQSKASPWVTFSEHKAMRSRSPKTEPKFNGQEDESEDKDEKDKDLFPQVKIKRAKKVTENEFGVLAKRRISCADIRSERVICDRQSRGSLQLTSSTPATPLNARRRFTTESVTKLRPFHLRKTCYTVMILGAPMVGKTSIVRQFLYDKFSSSYTPTLEEMYEGEFDINESPVTYRIQDVFGNYPSNFTGMFEVSLEKADAFVLVYSLTDKESWNRISELRDMIHEKLDPSVPIVVAANKNDLGVHPDMRKEVHEATVILDWDNGYVECSAKIKSNINNIFKELLHQAKSIYDLTPKPKPQTLKESILNSVKRGQSQRRNPRKFIEPMRRRQSLPALPKDFEPDEVKAKEKQQRSKNFEFIRRASNVTTAKLRRDSCTMQ